MARVHYELDKKESAGTLEIQWAAEDRYRLEMKLGEIFATELALGNRYYLLRSLPDENRLPAIQRFLIADLVLHPLKELGTSGGKVSRVRLEPNVEGNRICIEIAGDERYAKEECFDAKTRRVVSARVQDMAKYTTDLWPRSSRNPILLM